MLKISKQQVMDRWDTLPENLKEAIFDEHNADIVWEFCKRKHISDEKIKPIAGVAGDVLMGFLHPDKDEVSQEIQASSGIPKEIALEIAEELIKKIFNPLKTALEEIYAPAINEKELNEKTKLIDSVNISVKKSITPLSPEIKKEAKEKPLESPPPANLPFMKIAKEPENGIIKKDLGQEIPENKNETDEQPFLLHQEKPLFKTGAPPEKPSVAFRPEQKQEFQNKQKPVSAKVSLPFSSENNSKRIVHYSDLSTKLNNPDKDNTK